MSNNIVRPDSLRSFFEAEPLQESRDLNSADYNIVALGVCSLMLAANGDVFYVEHTEKAGDLGYCDGSIGTLSETQKWTNPEKTTLESPYNAWIRATKEELKLDAETFQDAGFYTDRSIQPERSFIFPDPENSKTVLLATTIIVTVENPAAITFDYRRSEEVLSTGFVPVGELLGMQPFRPGFYDWFSQYAGSRNIDMDKGSIQALDWIDSDQAQKTYGDVKV